MFELEVKYCKRSFLERENDPKDSAECNGGHPFALK